MSERSMVWTAFKSLGMLACVVLASACSQESTATGPEVTMTARSPIAAALPAEAPNAGPADAASEPLAAVTPASASSFPVNGILTPDRPLNHGDYLWSEDGVPPGRLTMIVDLKAQILYVYRGGIEIGRSAILYGANDKPTPTGTFPILEKDADHVSNLYGAPMPYMLRLTMDGIAIHGSEVIYGNGTHGCVGVPDEFAKTLFSLARVGDRVLITNGWRTDLYGT